MPSAIKQIRLVEGDITLPNLGISDSSILSQVTRIFHFAAVYDLSVTENLARLVNVDGTKNILDFAKQCKSLERLDYVSTCYVSGRYPGRYFETDLEKNQTFNNFYESTKFEAECLVKAEMNAGLNATIYRPAIVVGNSNTGSTQKFDGPYFVMQWLLRQPKIAFLPSLPHPERYKINVVPSNFVLDALTHLAETQDSIGKTFQLADPHPLTVEEMMRCLGMACNRRIIRVPLPKGLAKWGLKALPSLEKYLGIPYSALDYFDHPTDYDVSATLNVLKGTGINCPSFSSYAFTLVSFMEKHPHLRTKALT